MFTPILFTNFNFTVQLSHVCESCNYNLGRLDNNSISKSVTHRQRWLKSYTLTKYYITIQGVSKKMSRSFYLISLATSSLESWDVSQIKADIHRYVLSTISFLCDIGEPRYRQNDTGYRINRIVKYCLKLYP